jgi:hypothetical protein
MGAGDRAFVSLEPTKGSDAFLSFHWAFLSRSVALRSPQDRLILIYLATLAVQHQSQTIRFRNASEMLDTFALNKGGREYRRLLSAFERIFGATIFLIQTTYCRKQR